MRELGRRKRDAFYRRFLNQELSVLVEDRVDKETGSLKGFSRNYVPVLLRQGSHALAPASWINREVNVWVTEVSEAGVRGRIVEEPCERRTNGVPQRV